MSRGGVGAGLVQDGGLNLCSSCEVPSSRPTSTWTTESETTWSSGRDVRRRTRGQSALDLARGRGEGLDRGGVGAGSGEVEAGKGRGLSFLTSGARGEFSF